MTQETLKKASDLDRELHFAKQNLKWFEEAQGKNINIDGFDRNTFIVYKGIELEIDKDKAEILASDYKQKLLSEIESKEKELAEL